MKRGKERTGWLSECLEFSRESFLHNLTTCNGLRLKAGYRTDPAGLLQVTLI